MIKSSKRILITALIIILVNLLPFIAHAQPIGNIDPQGDVDAPFDGGITLLIIAGIGYGIRKARIDNKKNHTFPTFQTRKSDFNKKFTYVGNIEK